MDDLLVENLKAKISQLVSILETAVIEHDAYQSGVRVYGNWIPEARKEIDEQHSKSS